jgi:xanthine dehydrogenase accessory factor
MWDKGEAFLNRGEAIVLVTVSNVEGSSPREAGAMMVVTQHGISGTIGGGTMEWQAMAKAQSLLQHEKDYEQLRFNLGPDLGQCCGGRVSVTLERFTLQKLEAFLARRNDAAKDHRQLLLFGAGHVGRSLVLTLSQAPFDIIWCDPRPNAFPQAVPANVTLHAEQNPENVLAKARNGSIVLVMSHSHALDLVIVDAALRHPKIAATGLIGSATKRARFESRLRAANVPEERIQALICPIGIGEIRSKLPHAIAISTAAQVLALDEALANVEGKTEQDLLARVNP